MSSQRDELRRLVEELAEDEVADALRLVQRRRERPVRPWPPRWFGAAPGRRTDAAARSEELLEDGFGR